MNILLLCAFLTHHGGFENYVEGIIKLATKHGHRVRVFTPYKVQDTATIKNNLISYVHFDSAQEIWRKNLYGGLIYNLARAKEIVLNKYSNESDHLTARWRSRSFVNEYWSQVDINDYRDIEIVHMIGKPKKFLVDASSFFSRANIRILYSEVAQVTDEYANRRDHHDFIGRCNLVDTICVFYDAQGEDIRKKFGYSREIVRIEQWAYENEEKLLALKKQPNENRSKKVVGSLCRLSPEKGLETLLRAFTIALQSDPDLQLRIAGTGPLRDQLTNLSRDSGIDNHVIFMGYVQDRVEFYNSIDIFVVSSIEEGGPITAVEAMAAGLPVITTYAGAMPERLKHHESGLFFDAGSIEQLSTAILELAADEQLRRQMGKNARTDYMLRNHSTLNSQAQLQLWNRR
jgi:glycosyltransferase involved in cell wall biosynthesis